MVISSLRAAWSRILSALIGAALVLAFLGCLRERTPPIVVLVSSADPVEIRAFACPEGACEIVALERSPCEDARPAQVVVVAGHSAPPTYLGGSAERLADAIACRAPELVVLDTCYGFSAPLLEAMALRGLTPLIVGSTHQLPPEGLDVSPAFFQERDAAARAAGVFLHAGTPLETWRLDGAELRRAREEVARWSPERLNKRLRRVHPNLVQVELASGTATMLVPVAPERFRR